MPTTPFAPGGTAAARLLEKRVNVFPYGGRLFLLRFAEGVAKPAHHQAAVEADSFHHPLVGDGVAKRSQPRMRIDARLVEDERVLPEASPNDGETPRLDDADAEQTELRVGPADHDRRALAKPVSRAA